MNLAARGVAGGGGDPAARKTPRSSSTYRSVPLVRSGHCSTASLHGTGMFPAADATTSAASAVGGFTPFARPCRNHAMMYRWARPAVARERRIRPANV